MAKKAKAKQDATDAAEGSPDSPGSSHQPKTGTAQTAGLGTSSTKTEEKTLTNSDVAKAREAVSDLVVVGNGDAFQLLCKAASVKEGWMKSTKAMVIPRAGCLVQVSTQQRNPDGSWSVAEALTWAPGVTVQGDVDGGRKLVRG